MRGRIRTDRHINSHRRWFRHFRGGGDGSTLSLDFTAMSGLDSRFTFSRSSPATFINSSGLVRYADHNLWYNTAFAGLSGANPSLTSSGWQYVFAGAGKTVTFNGDGSVTMSTSSGTDRISLARITSIPNTTLNLVVAFDIVADNSATYGTLRLDDLITEGSINRVAYYVNGVSVAGSTVVAGPCNVTAVIQKTGGGTVTPSFGLNLLQAHSGAFTLRFANPRFGYWSGTATFPYLANTSTSVERHDARFDYDPTTLAPRGLLIEGSATNLVKYSQELNQVSGVNQWYASNFNTPTVPTSPPTDPFGGTSASWKLVAASGSAFHLWRFAAVFTAADYTFSFWAKAAEYDRITLGDVGSGRGGCSFILTGNGSTVVRAGTVTPTNPRITPYGNGWYKCEVTMLMTAATYGIGIAGYPSATTPSEYGPNYNADGTSGVYATGFQAELGSGASSYIPTGASTVQRAADSCAMTGTNFSSWFTSDGTFYFEFDNSRRVVTSANPTPIALGQYAAGDLVGILMNTGNVGSGAGIVVWGNGGTGLQQQTITGGSTVATGNKAAFAFSVSGKTSMGALRNGISAAATTTGTVNAKTILFIGGSGSGTALVRDWLDAPIQRIKFFPVQMTSAQLQALTA